METTWVLRNSFDSTICKSKVISKSEGLVCVSNNYLSTLFRYFKVLISKNLKKAYEWCMSFNHMINKLLLTFIRIMQST